ncbi:MAG: DUF2256 domain-containing protein [Gemmatimonas sp.]|nr:DUF2256 domain-containing protein [Gemmatimonas sp.]
MPRMRKKSELPEKDCLSCGRPFTWRKKWERDWDAVKYCSDACRRRGVPSTTVTTPAGRGRPPAR